MRINPCSGYTFKQRIERNAYNIITKTNPVKEEDTNRYILAVDNATQSLPGDRASWDKIYAMDLGKKMDLANILKLTYKNYDRYHPYPTKSLLSPISHPLGLLYETISMEKILSDTEIGVLFDKTKGAYNVEQLRKLDAGFYYEKDEFKENLKFIKVLMSEENKDVFDKMSPGTVTGILFNHYLSFDDFCESLENIKEDDVLSYPEDEIKESIHSYLLGESYSKIEHIDLFDKDNS